jgi:hypothetical protein
MANTPDMASCLAQPEDGGELLPLSPFYALHYHFGMLLGVDDFETEQAYHRAKMRLHNAWLHRAGVVWGFNVRQDLTRGEIRVLPGLALDAAGHELHLEGDACVNVGQWFDAHKKDEGFVFTESGSTVHFDAHVVIRFKACLTRQVPALLEPCDGANTSTAYSRVFETIEILLKPGPAPARVEPYHRLRLLFGIDQPVVAGGVIVPADQEVLDERNRILTLARESQSAAYLQAFHRFAALDVIDLQPAMSADGSRQLLFPAVDDAPVVLADITGVTLEKNDTGWTLTAGVVDTSVRPSHVATSTIQDLLCGLLSQGGAAGASATGPRVNPASVNFDETAKKITFQVDSDLHVASVTPAAFSVTWFDSTGWHAIAIDNAVWDSTTKTVTLALHEAPAGDVVRFIARGAGETPLLGVNFAPLAGAISDPPVVGQNGNDFVCMHKRS